MYLSLTRHHSTFTAFHKSFCIYIIFYFGVFRDSFRYFRTTDICKNFSSFCKHISYLTLSFDFVTVKIKENHVSLPRGREQIYEQGNLHMNTKRSARTHKWNTCDSPLHTPNYTVLHGVITRVSGETNTTLLL